MAILTNGSPARSQTSLPIRWTLGGAAFVVVTGTVWHFAFGLLGRWPPLALVFPVNESTWEHLKLAFWPMLIWAAIERPCLAGRVSNFLRATVAGIAAAIAVIPLFFYTYTGIIGHDVFWLDIVDFVTAVAIGYAVRLRIMRQPQAPGREIAAKAILGLMLAAFLTFSFFPPASALFRDPRSGGYGIPAGDSAGVRE